LTLVQKLLTSPGFCLTLQYMFCTKKSEHGCMPQPLLVRAYDAQRALTISQSIRLG
jgi:hypothetical protein